MKPVSSSSHCRWFVWFRHVLAVLLIGALMVSVWSNVRVIPAFADTPGFALEFNGTTNYVRLARTNSVMGGAGWATTKSVSLWVKPTGSAPAIQPESGQLILGTDFPRLFGINRANYAGGDRLWIWNWDNNGVDRIGVDFVPGEWVHLAFVHNGSTLAAYKNGVLVGSVASGVTYGAGSIDGTLYFGGSGRAEPNTYFAGQIDELRLWNVALSQSAIADWMTQDATAVHPNFTNLAADYRMSAGSGTTLAADTGYNQPGALLGGMGDASWVASTAFEPTPTEPTPIATEPSPTPEEPTPTPEDPTSTPEEPTPVPNVAPVANPQEVAVDEDSALNITLTGSDADEDDLTFEIILQPSKGTLSGTPPEVVYTPHADETGADSFTFVTNDGTENSAGATVAVTITPLQDAPEAVDDSIEVMADTPIVIDVLANDGDVDGDTLTISDTGAAAHGDVVNNGDDITYTPHLGYSGTDSFSYTISDGNGSSASAVVNVTVVAPPETGAAGFALAFDGMSDYVRLAESRHIYGEGWETNHSVSLWVKPTGPAAVITRGPAWCDSIFGDRPRWWGISHCSINGFDRIWVWNYDGNYDLIGVTYTTNEWVNVALGHNGGQLTAYRNGVAMGSLPTNATMQPHTGALPILHIGAVINGDARNWSFQGEIDEVRLWNIPLSEGQLQQTLTSALSGNEAGLAAYYQMSNGGGSTLADDSVNTWDGTLEDGLPPTVPPDGPITWVQSGAFDEAVVVAQSVLADDTVMLIIEGPPESEVDDAEINDQEDDVIGPNRLFLPNTRAE